MATGTFTWTNRKATLFREQLRRKVLFAPIGDQYDTLIKLPKAVEEFGKKKGENWLVTRRDKLRGSLRRIKSDEYIPQGTFSDNETRGYIYEYGRSIPWERYLEDLSQRNIVQEITDVLKEDAQLHEASAVLYQLLTDTHYFMCPTAIDTVEFLASDDVSDFTATTPVNFNMNHLEKLVTRAHFLQIPKINGRYLLFSKVGGFDTLWRQARQELKYTEGHSVVTGREVPIVRGCECIELNFDTPDDFDKNGTAFLTPITGRVAYTAGANQAWFGTYATTGIEFHELLLAGGDDCIEKAVVRPLTVDIETANFERLKEIAWDVVHGFKQPWDEVHASATSVVAKGRVRTILVTTESASLSYA